MAFKVFNKGDIVVYNSYPYNTATVIDDGDSSSDIMLIATPTRPGELIIANKKNWKKKKKNEE